jgi:hypothetical protein
MYEKKRTINGRPWKPHSFKVFIYHEDDRVEGKKYFTDMGEASSYFKELCGMRTPTPALVVGISGHDMKKYFRIDEVCHEDRVLLDLDWISSDER